MSKLSDALDNCEVYKYAIECGPKLGDSQLIVDAARRVANLDIDAAVDIAYQLRYVQDGDDWNDQIEDVTKRAVNAALGVSG